MNRLAYIPRIVIVIILALVLIGAVYLIYLRGEGIRRERAAQEAEQIARDTNNDAAPAPEQTTTEQRNDSGSAAPEPARTTPVATTQTDTRGAQALPQTGSADSLYGAFVLGSLTLAVASYLSSRRALT